MSGSTHIHRSIASAVCLVLTAPALAVDLDVPGSYATIQDAIDAAVDGDRVMIDPGTYFESIDFLGKQIIVRSVDRDPATVTIDASGLGDEAVHFSGLSTSDAKLIGVTVTGGDAGTGAGGGIYINEGDAVIRRCIIRDNVSDNVAAGVYCSEGSPEISQCLVYDNVSTGGGAGVYLRGPGAPLVVNCVITANETVSSTTAGLLGLNADLTVRNSIIRGNIGVNLNQNGGTLDVEHSNIEDGFVGTGNIDELPKYVNYSARNLRLMSISPCIDAGDSSALGANIDEDLARNPRRMHDPNTANTGIGVPIIDMGAYEFQPRVRYVDIDAIGAGTGTTWDDAYVNLVDAIAAVAADAGADEIWVANGTYKADQGTGDRAMSFDMQSGQIWYGGFAGGELFADERDWVANQVILGGAIGAPGDADDTYHIVSADAVDNTAIMDGFIIQEGNADDSMGGGGGMFIVNGAAPQLRRLWIRLNDSSDGVGGVYIEDSAPTFVACRINRNVGAFCGGVLGEDTQATFHSCIIGANDASNGTGGMQFNDSLPSIFNCTTYANTGSPGIATHGLQANNCTLKLGNSIFWSNQGNQQIFVLGGVETIFNSSFEDTYHGVYGHDSNNGTDPQFVDLDGANNVLGDADDDFRLSPESNCIDSGNSNVGGTSDVDILGNSRRLDDLGMPDTGSGSLPIIDRGAVEFTGTSCAYDCDGDGTVGIGDLLFLLGAWGDTNGNPICEYVGEPGGDGVIDVLELLGILSVWGDCL